MAYANIKTVLVGRSKRAAPYSFPTPQPIMPINYVLVSLVLDAGNHRGEEEMKFIKILLTSSGFSKTGKCPVPEI